ncbi:MAG: peptidylprolyl isomerase, partial [Bacteroidota bacterium]
LFTVPKDAAPADTLKIYQRATMLKQELNSNNFAAKAKEFSEDKFSKESGGRIGYINAPLPNGLYALETAVYGARVNSVVGPIRTNFGYHLAIVHDRRPARGEIEAAQVMTRKPQGGGDASAARNKIERAYQLLQSGQPFEQVASTISEDEKTSRNGGYIGFFGINRYATNFEEAAFGLANDGDYSAIVESKVGFHIIRRISRRGVQPLADQRALLVSKVKADSRFAAANDALLAQIRQRANLQENVDVLDAFAKDLVDSVFLNFRWRAPNSDDGRVLLRMGKDHVVSLGEFQTYLQKNARQRMRLRTEGGSEKIVKSMYQSFLNDELMAFAESRLEETYPEFRALMREYEEGILLFEATKMEVWDKASEDTTGLKGYFAAHRDDYRWEERARVSLFTIYPNLASQAGKIYGQAGTMATDSVLNMYASTTLNEGLKVNTDNYERNRLPQLADVAWQAGSLTALARDDRSGQATFYKIEEILPSGLKELDEARGYIIADYQDQLEQEWVNSLRERYSVKMRKRVFEKMVRR